MQSLPTVLQTAAARSNCSQEDLQRFGRHLLALAPYQAARINPFNFAHDAGVDSEVALDLFVHGAKLGLFDLEWGMICPMCGAITHSVSELDRVAADVVHCSLCQRDAEAALDETIEVTFAYTPPDSELDLHDDFLAYLHYFTSPSYPYRREWQSYHQRHTVGDVKLQVDETAALELSLQPGDSYRLLCLDTHSGANVMVADGDMASSATAAAAVALTATGFSQSQITLRPGDVTLSVTNTTDQPVWCRVLRTVYEDVLAIVGKGPPQFSQRLTGKHLLNNQAFRDSFALNELAPDLRLKLRNLTLLFSDLKGSTALYDREGDLAAYRLVQDHFAALKQVVRDHSGAVIKTMGDAVMAAFSSSDKGTAAAIAMMTEMQHLAGSHRSNDFGLKVGLHAGPALAINAGSNLDYFGQTVNIAARVQGLADAGEICLTSALNDDNSVPALLAEAGYSATAEWARLKGVSAEEQVFRYGTSSAK